MKKEKDIFQREHRSKEQKQILGGKTDGESRKKDDRERDKSDKHNVSGQFCNLIIINVFAMIASALNVIKSQKCHIQTNYQTF